MLKFALANLKTRLVRTILAAIAVILCTTMALISYNTTNQIQDGIVATAGFYDTIVGPEGSPLQLVLSSIFHVENFSGTIPYENYEKLKNNPAVLEAYPFASGDSYHTARIIGTIPEYLDRYAVKEGRMFTEPGEVVLGYNVAQSGVLQLNDTFFGIHGLTESGHAHEDFAYKVVGVLGKTGTAADTVIYTSIKSVWLVHGGHGESENDSHDEEDHEEEDNDEHITGDLVSVIIRTSSLSAHSKLVSEYNEIPGVQAVNPAAVLRDLMKNLNVGRDILYLLTVIIVFMAVVVIYVTTTSYIEDSKKDILVMRLVGIKRNTILSLFILQAAFISAVSIAISFVISSVALYALNRFTMQSFGIVIDGAKHYPGELMLMFSVFTIMLIASLLSILPSYRHDPLEVKR